MQKLKYLLNTSRILLVLFLLAFFAGCSDDEDQGSTTQPGTLDRLFTHEKIQACATCHTNDGGPVFDKANFHRLLVNKKRGDYPQWFVTAQECIGNYVVPYSANNSSILSIISNQNGACGALSIHEGLNAALNKAALDDFIAWIENGAPR